MQPLNIKLYDLARAKLHLNDTDAMDFVSSIHELQDHRFENLVTKEYLDQKLFGITEKMNQIDSNSIDRTNKLETKLSEKINNLENSISEFKSEILKWMFIFWVGQMSVTIAVVMMLIKK
jgi:uncharacterized protein (UPF0305 family)